MRWRAEATSLAMSTRVRRFGFDLGIERLGKSAPGPRRSRSPVIFFQKTSPYVLTYASIDVMIYIERKEPMGKKQKMSFYIPTDLYSKLRKAASRTKRTMTSIVVEATISELKRISPQKKVPR
jgi:hypothetical protein